MNCEIHKHAVYTNVDCLFPVKSPKKLLGSPTVLQHLQWMLKQDSLNRDMLLIGHPGPMLHWIVFQFSNLTQRKLEYATLGRDTAKCDKNDVGYLQQSKMQTGANAQFDDIVVRAAVHGSILVIKGIEQIERNIVPVLNNLLENREMHLQDGRNLISAQSYDKLQAVCMYFRKFILRIEIILKMCIAITGTWSERT